MVGAELARLASEDLDGATQVTLDATSSPGESPERRFARIRHRYAAFCATDPGGAWIAREDGRVTGVAAALRSDDVWVLAQLFVDPNTQSRGLGGALLERALTHAEGARGGLITASADPRAIRLYARAGFAPQPALKAEGIVDRATLPASKLVHEGDVDDVERTAAIDVAVRGGARPHHIAQMLGVGNRLFLARNGRGYAIGTDSGRIATLAATDEEAAQALLWRVLAEEPAGSPVAFEWITARQGWAVDVALRAGFALEPSGPLFTRGELGPLAPFLPSGAYS